MTENHRDDVDFATAAEQSSEEDEAQEGNSLQADEVEPAEHAAIHIEADADADPDLVALLAALDAAAVRK